MRLRLTDTEGRYPAAKRESPPAIRGLSLSIEAGEQVAVIGPSGAGKTTLLQLIGAALKPSAGMVWLNDCDVWSLPTRELQRLPGQLGIAPHPPPRAASPPTTAPRSPPAPAAATALPPAGRQTARSASRAAHRTTNPRPPAPAPANARHRAANRPLPRYTTTPAPPTPALTFTRSLSALRSTSHPAHATSRALTMPPFSSFSPTQLFRAHRLPRFVCTPPTTTS